MKLFFEGRAFSLWGNKKKKKIFLAVSISINIIDYINVIKQEFLLIFASIILQLNCTGCQ